MVTPPPGNPYRQAHFLTAASALDHLPPDDGGEVAFIGRSNAGKSSTINALTGQSKLARTAKAPGRTRELIFFALDDQRRLVDLPGYGYAKVPTRMRQQWDTLLDTYLRQRRSLSGLVLIMDVRRPLTDFDRQMLGWTQQAGLPVHLLLNKADKLSRGAAASALLGVEKALREHPRASVQLYSALRHQGVENLRRQLDHWLGFGAPSPAGDTRPEKS